MNKVEKWFGIHGDYIRRIEIRQTKTWWGFGRPKIKISVTLWNGSILCIEDTKTVPAQVSAVTRLWDSLYGEDIPQDEIFDECANLLPQRD